MDKLFKVSKQTLWQLVGKAVTSISTLILLGAVARGYGESGTGIFTLALTYLGIFYLLADFGFNAHLLNSFHKLPEAEQTTQWRKLLGTRLIWGSLLLSLSLVTLPFWPFTTPVFASSVFLGGLAILGSAIFVTANLVFQSKFRYDLSIIASSIGTIFGLVIIILSSHLQLASPYLLLAQTAGWIIIADIALILVRKYVSSISPIFDKKFATTLLQDSWPIAATLALNVVYFRADAFILAYFKTPADVGIYNISYSIFQSIIVLPTFIMNAYYPMMIESMKGIKVVAMGLFGLSILGVIFTYLFSPLLIQLLTGEGFNGAVDVLRILSLGFPAYFLSALLMWMMVIKKQYRTLLVIYGVGLGFNFIANLNYIPQYSFYASAWITVLSEYLILALQSIVLLSWKFE